MSLSSEQHDILTLFNLESENVKDIAYANEGSNAIIRILLRLIILRVLNAGISTP